MANQFDALAAAIEKLALEVSEGFAEQTKYTGEAYVTLDAKMDTGFARVDANTARLEAKMDTGFARVDANTARLEAEMDTGFARVDAKMDTGFARVDANAARLEAKMDSGFTRLERKLDQFIDTQIQTNQIVDRRLRLIEESRQ